MSTQFGGRPALVESNLPSAVNIASTTHATPVVITTSSPHGIKTGEYFVVSGATEPALNGVHLMAGTVTSTTIQALVAPAGTNTVGTVSGGAAGTVQNLGFGVTYPLPSDGPGNPRSAASVNLALEALGDRTAWLQYVKGNIIGGNKWFDVQTIVEATITNLLTIQALATLSMAGTMNIGGTANLSNGAILNLILGSVVNAGGTFNLNSGGVLDAKSGSRVIAEAGSMLGILGRSRIRAPYRPTNASQTIDTTQGNHVLLPWNGNVVKTYTLRQSTAPIPEEGEWMLLVADTSASTVAQPGLNYHFDREGAVGTHIVDLGDAGSWALVSVQSGVWRGLAYAGANVVPGTDW